MAHHVCPWWHGYVLASPLRKIMHNPDQILSSYIREGFHVLDIGCAMGFFSLPLARLVGVSGKVYSIDLQEKMLTALRRKAAKAGTSERIALRKCSDRSLQINDLAKQIDFGLVFAVVHELPDRRQFFREVRLVLKEKACLLMAEPRGHVTAEEFQATLIAAQEEGFTVKARPKIRGSQAALLQKTASAGEV